MSDREYRSEARKNNDPPISQVGSVGSNASAPSGASPPPGSTSPGLHFTHHPVPEPEEVKRTPMKKFVRWLKYGPID
ncbi:uncharacterized protein H6S33_002435 [Morchella sextelata]|uniref:uncharacterized protein n=1 Tax=Morchella sextelata TaxID=1174677 RepID=UPI001D04077F|nr:uncharacterized protein H6S33_002435 [Morchella sextelata]KAH0607401.1 hypothetical protein H6S33_002435 [Morchella sextelata]